MLRSVPPNLFSPLYALFVSLAPLGLGAPLLACGDDAAVASSDSGCVGDTCGCTECPSCDGCGQPAIAESGASSALVLPDGRLAIVTYDGARGGLVVVFQRPGSSERVVRDVSGPSEPDVGRWARMALEASGELQVAWYDSARGAVLWSRGGALAFTAASEVARADASHLALRVDAADQPHIAYRDTTARGVRYAARAQEAWVVTSIDGCAGESGCPSDAEDFGAGLDLALVSEAGSAALPRVAFYDALRGDLKLASRGVSGAWTTVALDGRGADVGRFVSLAVSPTRSLGVAYYDATLGALRFIGANGVSRVIDNGVFATADGRARRLDVGQLCALDFDTRGSAHIVYLDTSTPRLRHARIPGEGPSAVSELAIPAGAWPAFKVVGDRLVGAYGAFVIGAEPQTVLRLFDLPATEVAP